MNKLVNLHRDEEGLETLQVVMIIAVSAIILALVKTYWTDIKAWFGKHVDEIQKDDFNGNK